MSKLKLTLGCWDYDRVTAIQDGTIQPDGIDLNFLNMEVEETFFRMVRYKEFDASEMSLSSYTVSLFKDPSPFIAIPVFPSRFFRHSCIFVSAKSNIKEPKDLIGKKIGVPEYQMTAPVWIRGILDEHFGVPIDSVTYYTGGEEEPGRPEKQGINLPPNIKVEAIPDDKTLSQMLKDGEIDALHSARSPSTLDGVHVKRLFPNYREVELDYYRKTKIFPTMHIIAIRREFYEQNRWVAMSLFKAFSEAQAKTYHDLNQTAALKAMVPWLTQDIEEAKAEMGDDFWPYGLEKNYDVLSAFLRYHHQGGLSPRLLKPEELFAPETLETFKI